jgi:FkbM family methyltransferase
MQLMLGALEDPCEAPADAELVAVYERRSLPGRTPPIIGIVGEYVGSWRLYMTIINRIKDHLISLGPKHRAVQLALTLQGRLHGHRVEFHDGHITISAQGRRVTILETDYLHVPLMSKSLAPYFNDFEATSVDGNEMLDFTGPGVHKYRATGLEFSFPGIPEDDSMAAYLHGYRPSEGTVVWDLGAHAGMTAYSFSQMVGPGGHVYAFEPDDLNRRYLTENLDRLQVTNVTIVDWAVGKYSGKAQFSMDGSMTSGLVECNRWSDADHIREVEVVSLEDCYNRLGRHVDYIKADIEGAEVGFIEGALEFLKTHRVHFAFESMHWVPGGTFSCYELERLFTSIGYTIESSARYGYMFTWATPPSM